MSISYDGKVCTYQSADVRITVNQIGPNEYLVKSIPTQDADIVKATEQRVHGLVFAMELFHELIERNTITN